ncbi:hypothetical protein Save01_03803 [Streptomyces avermitilis]
MRQRGTICWFTKAARVLAPLGLALLSGTIVYTLANYRTATVMGDSMRATYPREDRLFVERIDASDADDSRFHLSERSGSVAASGVRSAGTSAGGLRRADGADASREPRDPAGPGRYRGLRSQPTCREVAPVRDAVVHGLKWPACHQHRCAGPALIPPWESEEHAVSEFP